MSKDRRCAATGEPRYQYVCSQWSYPSADEVDANELPYQVEAVYDTLDAALDYMLELIQTMCAPHSDVVEMRDAITCYWDPVNNLLRMRYRTCSEQFLISRIGMHA